MFHLILVNFEIINLERNIQGMGKVDPDRASLREPLAGLGKGMQN